jgi:mono/diheme cytochrome c family protein
MVDSRTRRVRGGLLAAAATLFLSAQFLSAHSTTVHAQSADLVKQGEYLIAAGGCVGCHTDFKNKGPALAGGRGLKTPFGVFYAPNITPHPEHGLGKWTEADFVRAMREGVAPDGSHYFPVFPYTTFTAIADADLKAMFAYLKSMPPAGVANKPHDVGFPFNWRFTQTFWKLLFFEPKRVAPDPAKSARWNRGAYLVNALTHCGECHTPRNRLGGQERDQMFAGAADGPEGESAPNITPDPETGIGKWSATELATYLQTGTDPSGDVAGSLMAEVIEHSTGKLTADDTAAIVEYVRSLAPVRNKVQRKH